MDANEVFSRYASGERDFRQAGLQGISLIKANLSKIDLAGANLRNLDLSGADLSNANFNWASLKGANLNETNLKEAKMPNNGMHNDFLDSANYLGEKLKGIHALTERWVLFSLERLIKQICFCCKKV